METNSKHGLTSHFTQEFMPVFEDAILAIYTYKNDGGREEHGMIAEVPFAHPCSLLFVNSEFSKSVWS